MVSFQGMLRNNGGQRPVRICKAKDAKRPERLSIFFMIYSSIGLNFLRRAMGLFFGNPN